MRISFDLYSFDGGSPSRPSSGCRYVEVKSSRALSLSNLPGLDWALNPYIGCEHGCSYCYVPSIMRIDRTEWGRLVKIRKLVPNLLFKELKQVQGVIGLGTMTDPYQPIEKSTGLTRRCLEQIARSKCRVSVHTKSDLVVRDIDIIGQMEGAEVGVTITTNDDAMALGFEPHAPPPSRRLEALRQLLDAGIDTYALIAPMIPMVTDSNMEGLMDALHSIGLKKVIIDRFRPRQGMIEHLNTLPVFDEKLDFHLFKEKAHSTEYFMALEGRISTLCHERGIECVSAF